MRGSPAFGSPETSAQGSWGMSLEGLPEDKKHFSGVLVTSDASLQHLLTTGLTRLLCFYTNILEPLLGLCWWRHVM